MKQLLLALAILAVPQTQATAPPMPAQTKTVAPMALTTIQAAGTAAAATANSASIKGTTSVINISHAQALANNTTNAAKQVQQVTETISKQVKTLAQSPAGQALANQVKQIVNKANTLLQFAQSSAAQAALNAYAEVEKQVNAHPTVAGQQSIKASAASYLAPHNATVAQAQEHLNDLQNAVMVCLLKKY